MTFYKTETNKTDTVKMQNNPGCTALPRWVRRAVVVAAMTAASVGGMSGAQAQSGYDMFPPMDFRPSIPPIGSDMSNLPPIRNPFTQPSRDDNAVQPILQPGLQLRRWDRGNRRQRGRRQRFRRGAKAPIIVGPVFVSPIIIY